MLPKSVEAIRESLLHLGSTRKICVSPVKSESIPCSATD